MIPTLLEVFTKIAGGFDTGFMATIKKLGEIRAEFPDVADQIDQLAKWLGEATLEQWTPEQLTAIAKQIIDLFGGKGWGPPNPNAVSTV